MQNQNQGYTQKASSCSIDHWQDSQPVTGPWLDSPIVGVLMLFLVTGGLLGWSMVSPAGPPRFAGEGNGAQVPSPEVPELRHDRALDRNETHVEAPSLPEPLVPLHVDEPERNPKPLKQDPELLSELVEAKPGGRSSYEIKMELSSNGRSDAEIVRLLCKQLRSASNPKEFEKIIQAICNTSSYVVSDNPDIKQEFVTALATAGRRVETSDLKEMDSQVTSLILKSILLPGSIDLLGKLAAIDDNWGHRVINQLSRLDDDQASKAAVKIAGERNINPFYLSKKDSVVCQYLWEGKFEGKPEFRSISVGNSEASLQAFVKTATEAIARDPKGTVGTMMAMSLPTHSHINRKSLPKQLLQKIDDNLAISPQRHFVRKGESFADAKRRAKLGKGPIPFLDLAKYLGGPKTAIAIAKMTTRNPASVDQFRQVRDILLSVNEPETYDAIVAVTAKQGVDRSNALANNIGSAIESNFSRKLKAEFSSRPKKKGSNDWTKRIMNMIDALDQIGTAKSLPILQQVAKSEKVLIKSRAEKAIKKIRSRTGVTAKPARPKKPIAAEAGTIKVSTNSGEAFRSSIDNIVGGKIKRSSLIDRLAFDPETMWHSDTLKDGWATITLDFPQIVTLNQIQIYSQHSGRNHLAVAAKVSVFERGNVRLLEEQNGLEQDATIRFKPTRGKRWKLELKAGKTKKIVVRGLRFFNGSRELYPPTELPKDE